MGNCMEACSARGYEGDQGVLQVQPGEGEENRKGMNGGGDGQKSGLRVKVVLTKEELELLMLRLNNKSVKKRLEDVLEEIVKGRRVSTGSSEMWKPSLDSITEIPEVPEMMER